MIPEVTGSPVTTASGVRQNKRHSGVYRCGPRDPCRKVRTLGFALGFKRKLLRFQLPIMEHPANKNPKWLSWRTKAAARPTFSLQKQGPTTQRTNHTATKASYSRAVHRGFFPPSPRGETPGCMVDAHVKEATNSENLNERLAEAKAKLEACGLAGARLGRT